MLSILLVPLMLSGVASSGAPAATRANSADPAPSVRVSLDRSVYDRGDDAHVQVDIRDDGYLVVLHVAPDGLVRVLFPLDPTDDNFVRGGKSYEIVGRGGRQAFTVDASSGTGVVYAAWSAEQFRFDDFTRDGHWDYTVIGDSDMTRDPETGLTNLVGRMATAHFDYDLQTYSAPQTVAYARPNYYMDSGYGYDPYYDPFYDPYFYGYGPFYGGGFISIGFGSPFFFRPFFSPFPPAVFFGRPFFRRPFFACFDCGVFGRPGRFRSFSPFRFKGGIPGGSTVVGIQYRPRTGFGTTAFATTPRSRFAGMSLGGMHALSRGPAMRPADVVGGRRVPASVRMPNDRSRFDGPTVFGPGRVSADPGRRPMFTGTRAVPGRPRFEPSVRAPEPYRGTVAPRGRAVEPSTRVSQPRGRAVEPSTRVNEPRGTRPGEIAPRRSAFQWTPRGEPAERVAAPRMDAPRMAPQRVESPRMQAPRTESPRFEGTRSEPRFSEPRFSEPRFSEPRFSAPRESAPRMSEPNMSAPRMSAPRMSAPRMSAPRMSAPRMSAPRMSAPRASAGGMRGGGGGGRHHR